MQRNAVHFLPMIFHDLSFVHDWPGKNPFAVMNWPMFPDQTCLVYIRLSDIYIFACISKQFEMFWNISSLLEVSG